MSEGGDPSSTTGRRVLVLGQIDGFANGVVATHVSDVLRGYGHEVRVVDTYHLSRAGSTGWRRRLPGTRPRQWLLFMLEASLSVVRRLGPVLRRRLSAPLLTAEQVVRRRMLRRCLPFEQADLVLCETPHDALVLHDSPARTMYHCPTPWADELFFEARLTARQHRRMRAAEARLFESVDHLAFHWASYGRYAVREYGISGRNLVTANLGCTPAAVRARYASPSRIVYLGSLSSSFIDLPLLSRLSRLMPVDVYGGPRPDPSLGLRYLGWAPPDVLERYQFGLITCTDDPLRRSGFSAKHLTYFAYGLPVLLPAWREDETLAAGSVHYTERTFVDVVKRASEPSRWRELSEAAQSQARRFSWENGLRSIDEILRNL